MKLLSKMDEMFLLDGDVHLELWDPITKTLLIDRDPENTGLSADTIEEKKKTILEDGWIPGLRSGCWVRGLGGNKITFVWAGWITGLDRPARLGAPVRLAPGPTDAARIREDKS